MCSTTALKHAMKMLEVLLLPVLLSEQSNGGEQVVCLKLMEVFFVGNLREFQEFFGL